MADLVVVPPASAPAPAPTPRTPFWDHWAVKVLIWAIPVIFASGAFFTSVRVLAADVQDLRAVRAEERLTVLESHRSDDAATGKELGAALQRINDNVVRLCQAQDVSCK